MLSIKEVSGNTAVCNMLALQLTKPQSCFHMITTNSYAIFVSVINNIYSLLLETGMRGITCRDGPFLHFKGYFDFFFKVRKN